MDPTVARAYDASAMVFSSVVCCRCAIKAVSNHLLAHFEDRFLCVFSKQQKTHHTMTLMNTSIVLPSE